jgi:cyclin B
MEKAILNTLEWNLTLPTTYHFLVRFAKAAGRGDKQVKIRFHYFKQVFGAETFVLFVWMQLENMVLFFGELALMDYRMVTIRPSAIAASVVYAARCTLKKSPLWTDTLEHHTGLHEQQLM